MLTGEYAVLEGAACLSFPAKQGQTLTVEAVSGEEVEVMSLEADGSPWLHATFDLKGQRTSGPETAKRLEALFEQALLMRGFDKLPPSKLTFQTQFDRSWGLGSSSTLVHLVAQWLEVDAMKLFQATDTGSGYDLATTLAGKPIVYQLRHGIPHWEEVQVAWPFVDHLWLVPMGVKQKSDAEVKKFKDRGPADPSLIEGVTALTSSIALSTTLNEFTLHLEAHEAAISTLIGRARIQSTLRATKGVTLKSLGAWGGDLLLAVGSKTDVVHFSQVNALGRPQPFGEVVVI